MSEKRRITRREAVKAVAALGLAVPPGTIAQEKPADSGVSPDDIAAADRVAGRSYSESERKLMAGPLTRIRASLKALRQEEVGDLAPAVRFDPRLPGMVVPNGRNAFKLSKAPTPAYAGPPESLAFASAVELSRLLRARRITSTELTRMYLDRLKRLTPRLLNVVTITEELALRQAAQADEELADGKYRSPLHGIPYGAKDLLATKGIRTTWGAKPYESQVFDYDATVVKRLEDAGAVLIAKTALGELAMGDVWFGGMSRNPWAPDKGSSGSSAGSGSGTAAGLFGFAIGTETLGSIVSPSVVNGVTGLRPTFGRVPRTGAMALSWTMDKIGPMCRTVEDCAMVLSVIYGPDGEDLTVPDIGFRWNPESKISDLRIGVDSAAFDQVAKNEKRAPIYKAVLDTLERLGVTLRPISLPKMKPAYQALPMLTIDAESATAFQKLTASGKLNTLVQQREGSWPNTFRVGSTIPASDYLQAMRIRTRLMEEMAEALKEVDCYLTIPFAGPTIYYTNMTGHPTLITRCGMLDGLPQSVEFVGQLYREDAILRLGHAYEQATDHHKQWPDLSKLG